MTYNEHLHRAACHWQHQARIAATRAIRFRDDGELERATVYQDASEKSASLSRYYLFELIERNAA